MLNYDDVRKAYQDYASQYRINNQRGKDCIQFALDNEQWDPQAISLRAMKNKETIVHNNVVKYLNKIKSQRRQIDYQFDVFQTIDNNTQGEYQSFDMLMKHWFTERNVQEKMEASFDKCVDYGYAVAEVNYAHIDKYTLNLDPVITIYDNPSEAFFDLKCQLKSRIDGNFCGRRRMLNKRDLLATYPQHIDALKDKHNEVIDFWHREQEKAWFVQLQSGIWHRQDLLGDDDFSINPKTGSSNVKRKPDGTLIRRRGTKDSIYYYRFVNEKAVIDRRPYPTEDLPLVYHAGLSYWTDEGVRTYPYVFYLKDPQRYLNLIKSQVATNLKNATATKYFWSPEHITNDKQKDELRDINMLEGSVVLGADPRTGLIVPPTEIPASLINLSASAFKDLETVSGAMSEAQASDNAIVSGVALKEITNNIQMINAGLISEDVRFQDSICRLLVQMLPNLYTEERVFYVKNQNGQMQKVGINLNTGSKIVNDIKNLRNKFIYEVKAGPTTVMQRETTLKSLMEFYKIAPQFAASTGDIFFKNTDTPESAELARRAAATIDPMLIKVGNGDITQDQYQQYLKQQQQQQQQAAQQPQPSDQASMMAAHATMMNAQTNQMKAQSDAQLNAAKLQLDAQNNEQKNSIQSAKVLSDAGDNLNSHQIDEMRLHLESIQKIIDVARLHKEASSDQSPD
jgi:hypothetical protein